MLRASSKLFGKTLVVAEAWKGKLVPATLAAITAGAQCGPVTAFFAGKETADIAEQLAKVKGVTEVIAATGENFVGDLPEEVCPALESIVVDGGYTHVFAASSAFGKGVIPRLAVKLDVMPLADIMKVVSEDTFVRGTYAGNAIATVKSNDKVKLATVRAANFDRAATEGGSASIKNVAGAGAQSKAKWVEDMVAESDTPDLTVAPIVVTGGRALKSKDNFKLMFDLAKPLGAAVGATRAAVDADYASNDMQIGQTGKTVAPQLYLAAGVSGAIQHVAGMKDSKVIACINTDPDAAIFAISDYGLEADLFQAVPEMTKLVTK
jgi:electron transfer flavoprotein alpha subunit